MLKARKEAQEAQLVVINHHLLFADMALRENGFGELLPNVDALIIDEAHQLPATASRFFGFSLTSRQLQELTRDSASEFIKESGTTEGLPDIARQLETTVQKVRLAMGNHETSASWSKISGNKKLQTVLQALRDELTELTDSLETEASRSRGLENCWRRAVALQECTQQATVSPPETACSLVRNLQTIVPHSSYAIRYR